MTTFQIGERVWFSALNLTGKVTNRQKAIIIGELFHGYEYKVKWDDNPVEWVSGWLKAAWLENLDAYLERIR